MFEGLRFLSDGQGAMTALAGRYASADQRHRALSARQAALLLTRLDRADSQKMLNALLELLAAGGNQGMRRPDRLEALARINQALEKGTLLIVPDWAHGDGGASQGAAGAAAVPPDDRLAAAVMGARREIAFEGNRYRVVSLRRWRQEQQQQQTISDFRLLPARNARAVVAQMAESSRLPATERSLWKDVLAKLFDGAGATEGGVVLLRHAPLTASATEAAAAPSAPAPAPHPLIATTHWIEIEVVYDDGTPFDGECTLELPGGVLTSGPAGEGGLVRVEGIDPGSCKLSFPDLHQDAWALQ